MKKMAENATNQLDEYRDVIISLVKKVESQIILKRVALILERASNQQ